MLETNNPARVDRFFAKVNKDGPLFREDLGRCWEWVGAKDSSGYGNFTCSPSRTCKAHRFSFLLCFGWLLSHPYQIDHKCENTSCVRPSNLFCLLGKENNEKSNSASAINKRKTHCKHGHEFSDENTIRRNGKRYCITCEKERGRM